MRIIAHRGYWLSAEEQNSVAAFQRALDFGLGLEIDVWVRDDIAVVSHEPPGSSSPSLNSLLATLCPHENFRKVQYALNIKSDSLEKEIEAVVVRYKILENVFVFDMSAPSMYRFLNSTDLRVAARLSEYEPIAFESLAHGIWLDAWESESYDASRISNWLGKGKFVAIVSPELHNRKKDEYWKWLQGRAWCLQHELYICTDDPKGAKNSFGGG